MNKVVLIGVALALASFLLPSCAADISQEQSAKATTDLVAAQAQIQSLQSQLASANSTIAALQGQLSSGGSSVSTLQAQISSLQSDKDAIAKKSTVALAYAEFFDVLMYPAWKQASITPRFTFSTEVDWLLEVKNRANRMGDTKLTNYVQELEKGGQAASAAMSKLMDYCLEMIEKTLK